MVICFDTETTSLYPGQICQLSYVMQDGEKLMARNLFFTVDEMDYSAFMVHGFSKEKLLALSNGKRFSDYIDIIEKDFSLADIVVSHNTAFDFQFMRAEFERLNRTFLVKNEFCTMKKSTPICKLSRSKGSGYKYPKLAELCNYFGITDNHIMETIQKVFGVKAGFHDARFDSSALLLALNYGAETQEEFKIIKEFL